VRSSWYHYHLAKIAAMQFIHPPAAGNSWVSIFQVLLRS
jgi:hypothetical protein